MRMVVIPNSTDLKVLVNPDGKLDEKAAGFYVPGLYEPWPEAKEKGFFVYSKCGLGPHKVLKRDGTFSIKLNRNNPVKIFKSRKNANMAASKYQHTKLNLKVGVYPDEYLMGE